MKIHKQGGGGLRLRPPGTVAIRPRSRVAVINDTAAFTTAASTSAVDAEIITNSTAP